MHSVTKAIQRQKKLPKDQRPNHIEYDSAFGVLELNDLVH